MRDFLQNSVFKDFNLAFKSEKHVALNMHFDGPDGEPAREPARHTCLKDQDQ